MDKIKSLLKDAGLYLLAIVFLVALIVLAVAWFAGAAWVAERVLPWLSQATGYLFAACVVVFLPLAIVRRTRPWGGLGFFVASYVYGLTAWFMGAYFTWHLAGPCLFGFGIMLAGIGVVPIAVIALCIKGLWTYAGLVTGISVLTIILRAVGLRLVEGSQEKLDMRADDSTLDSDVPASPL